MEEERKAYSEVVEILKSIEDEQKLKEIPYEVIELIKSKSDPEYQPKISKEDSLDKQNLQEQTYKILCWLAIKFWDGKLPTEEKTEKSVDTKENRIIELENQSFRTGLDDREKVTIGGVYNDIEPSILYSEVISVQAEKLPIPIESLNWYKKMKSKIIKLLKKVLGINKSNIQKGVNE